MTILIAAFASLDLVLYPAFIGPTAGCFSRRLCLLFDVSGAWDAWLSIFAVVFCDEDRILSNKCLVEVGPWTADEELSGACGIGCVTSCTQGVYLHRGHFHF